MGAVNVTRLPIAALEPNGWNPNQMTDAECEELEAEVRHLGRVPKPIVVRRNGDGYQIIDGEHSWKAAKGCEIAEVDCEVVEADDFESMRQTYKRNQHGRHDQVKQGKMFRSMMEARGLSQRQLAEEVELSEGTVRNSLLYADAAQRFKGNYGARGLAVGEMNVKQVRWAMALPQTVAEVWIDAGADIKALPIQDSYSSWQVQNWENTVEVAKKYEALEGLFAIVRKKLTSNNFRAAAADVLKLWEWEKGWARNGVERDDLRVCFAAYWRHFSHCGMKRCTELFDRAFALVIGTDTAPATWRISAHEFAEVCDEKHGEYGDTGELHMCIKALVLARTGSIPEEQWDARARLAAAELVDAPDYIQESKLPVGLRYLLWKSEVGKGYWEFGNQVDPQAFEGAKREVAARESVYYAGSPGWSDESALNWQLAVAIKRSSYQATITQSSNLELARRVMAELGLYTEEAQSKPRGYMIATLEQLTKVELILLLDTCRDAQAWASSTARIKALEALLRGTDA